jgi:chromosome transmission fidelity protein 8
MPTIPLHCRSSNPSKPTDNPLPQLLHTPSGLAILELQGTFHFPVPSDPTGSTLLGKLVFPLYNPSINDLADTKWMKRVYLYVGKGQRMSGEVKKLGKPLGVVRRVQGGDARMEGANEEEDGGDEGALEIVEVVRWKVVFSSRPEPVGAGVEEEEG